MVASSELEAVESPGLTSFHLSSPILKVGWLVGHLYLFLGLLHNRQFVCAYNNKGPGEIKGYIIDHACLSLFSPPSSPPSPLPFSLPPSPSSHTHTHTHTPTLSPPSLSPPSLTLSLSQSSYKQRFVVLKMRGEGQGKLVEVWDSQTSDKDPYRLVLGNSWTVQSKPSNSGKRFAFQVNISAAHDHDLIV